MKKFILLCIAFSFSGILSAQTIIKQTGNGAVPRITKSQGKKTQSKIAQVQSQTSAVSVKNKIKKTKTMLSPAGKLLSVDGYEVEFRASANPSVVQICGTPSPYVEGNSRDAACGYAVPCDNAANRDAADFTTIDYFQLKWHVMMDGGASSNIDQIRIDQLMAELNADFASANMIFCADPATFTEDASNYTHNSNTEEVSLKTTYNVNPTQFINIYVVGSMTAGGYARFPYDPSGGTSATGGVVLNRGNCSVGTHTLAHEMGHVFGLEHTFAGVDERSSCSNCYEKVRNVNGSSNTTGVGTPLGGPYTDEGDREGDWCSDTNPHDTYPFNCSTSSNTNEPCNSNPWANAPVNNHMSYSFCSSQFTDQQIRRAHCMIDSYLGSWIAYGGGICGWQPPAADFVASPTVWQAPSAVTFTDLSEPSPIVTSWTWQFDVGAGGNGVTCVGCTGTNATFLGQNPPAVTYPNAGLYTVSLSVTSANGNDTETKVDEILVNAPAGDCVTLTTQWENPTPTKTAYTFGGGWISGVPDPINMNLPTDKKGIYERYFSPNPGTTPVGAVRVGLGWLRDDDDDIRFDVVVYDDDGFGAPGAILGGAGDLSPTQLGVLGPGFSNDFWIPFLNAPVPTTASFHVGVEIYSGGDATDTLVVITSCVGPSQCAVAEGEADASNHIWTSGYGFENFLTVYGADFDIDIIPMLGEYNPAPIIEGFTETVICATTYVTLFDTVRYSTPTGWTFTFSDGTVINSATDPETINRVYTTPGPDTVQVDVVNDCGRTGTTTFVINYNFLETPSAEFAATQTNPICLASPPPHVNFTANTAGYDTYLWDFGDGITASSAGSETVNHVYLGVGTYYVELSTTVAGFEALDTFYLEDFESGWPVGYARYDNDAFTPASSANPPFTGTDATAWLTLDEDGDGNTEAVSTSRYTPAATSDDWMLTTAIGPLPANQRLFWNAEAGDNNFPDGYEVRISTTQLPANTTNYSTVLYSIAAENSFETERSADLSAYSGQTVYIAFRNNSTDMYLLFIDDLRVGTATTGCSASLVKTDYINIVDCTVTPPTAVIVASTTSGCDPLTVTCTDGSTVGDPVTSWLWSFGDGTFSSLQNPTAHVYSAGTYLVTLETCNDGGCTTDQTTIVVSSTPTIASVNADGGVEGDNVAITGTGFNTAGETVTLGGTSMSIVSSINTEIVATLPSGQCSGNIVVTNGCSAASAGFAYTYYSFQWIGTTSSDWSVNTNWCGGVTPTSSDDVYISVGVNPAHVTSDPSSPALCNAITIASGATLTIDAGKALTVSGNVSNTGTLLIKADATGIGSLITEGTVTSGGSFQMEQYVTGAGGATPNGLFYYVASPVVGADASTYDIASGNKLWSADETTQSYPQIINGSTILQPTEGYVARMGTTGAVTLDGSTYNTGAQTTGATLTRTGILELNRGYNLVGNPYPSTVSWDDATKTNLEPSVYYRTHQGATMLYDTYNTVGSIGTNNNLGGAVTGSIPPTQAFWVRVPVDGQTGTLAFDNSMRSHGMLSGIYKVAAEEGTIRLELSDATISDEQIILFNPAALDGYDNYDSQKFWTNGIPQLYTNLGTDSLAINGLNSPATNPIIPLGVKVPVQGNYWLNATSITFTETPVYLEDIQLNVFQNLNTSPTYQFETDAGNIGDRFQLHFSQVTGVDEIENSIVVYSVDNQIHVSLEGSSTGIITVLDVAGRTVHTQSFNATRKTIELQSAAGIYLVQVKTPNQTVNRKVFIQ
jgi:PKD repeat protein